MTTWCGLRVAFRADASVRIGHGHVMRCLTLADALREAGAECHFVCRAHEGHLTNSIRARGHAVTLLPVASDNADSLGADWHADAEQTMCALDGSRPHWVVVDHYAIDKRWEAVVAQESGRIAVIDDLANRDHACTFLLDQTLGRVASDYAGRVPRDCVVLAGAGNALLRPEFAALRTESLTRRHDSRLRRLLVSVGGVDANNAAGCVLETLATTALVEECAVTVAISASAPHLASLRDQTGTRFRNAVVEVDTPHMARLLVDCDLAIGAAGTSSWERCCLGVPSIVLVLADNQRAVAQGLQEAGAALCIGGPASVDKALPAALRGLVESRDALTAMSAAASRVTDGRGAARVIAAMEALHA